MVYKICRDMGKRIDWIDTLKYICIIFVMCSHLESCTPFWTAIYSPIYLNGFFFASGYVYVHRRNFELFIYKKLRQLFIPWFVFSVFNICLSHVLTFNEHDGLKTELLRNMLQIRGHGDEIWFVAALFVAFIPFYFFVDCYECTGVRHKTAIAVLIAWLFSLSSIIYLIFMPADVFPWRSNSLPWHLEYAFQAMFYMILGYLFRKQGERRLEKINSTSVLGCFLIIYALLICILQRIDFTIYIISKILLQYTVAIIGIIVLILVTRNVKPNRYIRFVGQNTLVYFALHGKFYSVLQTFFKRYWHGYRGVLGNEVASSVFCLGLAIILSVLLIVPACIINKWFPFILGRKKATA